MPIYKSLLPSEYQQVEYIQSSGVQYIADTIDLDENVDIKAEIEIVSFPTTSEAGLFGKRGSGASNNNISARISSSNQIVLDFNNSTWTAYRLTVNDCVINKKYKIIINKNERSVYDGSTLLGTNNTVNNDTISLSDFPIFQTNYSTYKGSIRVYTFIIKENGTLVRNFIPCYRKADNVIGLYDKVNGVFYTYPGETPFTKGNDVMPKVSHIFKGTTEIVKVYKGTNLVYSALPIGYQRVEYIESTGTQYIETNLGFGIKLIIDIQFTQTTRGLMGYNGNGGNYWGTNDNNRVEIGSTYLACNTNDRNVFEINFPLVGNYPSISLNDQTVISQYEMRATTSYYKFFKIDSYQLNSKAKLYSCKIYENNVLVRNFIPCYRKSDNVIGLFDTINQVFYTNAGTGTFLKGADIN